MAFAYFAETELGEVVFTGRNLNFLIQNGHKASEDSWISQIKQIEVEKFSSSTQANYEIHEFSELIKNAHTIPNAYWGLPEKQHFSYSATSSSSTITCDGADAHPAECGTPEESKSQAAKFNFLQGRTAVYEYYNDSADLIYCGISANPFRRWTQHLRSKPWAEEVSTISIEWCDSRELALTLEHAIIIKQNPTYNLSNGEHKFEALPEHLLPETRQLRKSLCAMLHNCTQHKKPIPFGIDEQAPLPSIISDLKSEFGCLLAAGRAIWDIVNSQVGSSNPYPYGQDRLLHASV